MASDYPYSGSNDQQAYRQQQQQQQQQQHQQQQQQHQQQHQSRMPSQQNDQQVSQYNSPQLLQHGNFDPYSAAQFQQYTGGQYTSMQPSSSSSSLQNNENQRFSMVARHPIRGGMPGNALVSPSPARSSSSAKAPRARVNMACVHCRSRKIRCDGNQPMCATCSRLGRACVYENISEQENAAVRDKKKRSRDAKQARLETLNQLGVSMPRQQQSTGMQDSYRQRPYPMFSGAVPSSSVLRSQFQSANAANQGMMPPSFTQQNAQQQYRDRTWQSQTPTTQFVSAPITNEPIPSNHTRRRGATVGGFEKLENENDLQPDPTFWQNDRTSNAGSTASNADLPYTPAMEGNPVMEAGSTGTLYDVIAPRVNSLSQPATPEAAYRFHASILSHELSTNTSTSTGQPSPQENAYFNNAYQGQPSAFSLGPAYQPNMNQNHDNGAGSNSSAGSFSMTPAMQSSVSEDNLYSAGSMYMGRAEQYGNLSSLTPIVNPANQSFQPTTNAEDQFGQSNINSHTDGQNPIDFSNEAFELTEEQRRRSIEDKKMWKKTTNSDAAIARFFARVVAAREGELESNDVPVCGPGGYNIPAWSHNTNLSLAQDTSITSSSASSWSGQEISGMTSSIVNGTTDGQMTGSTDLTGNTGQMGHSNAQTPESGVPVRRGSGLSHLSQASMVPLSANNTPPSDTAGFRNQRPPPLQFDTLPTFAQQHNIAQLTQQDHTSANTFVESPMTTIQGSGTNMSTSFSQQRMQPSVLTPLSGSSSIALQSPTYMSSNMSSNHSPGAPTIMNQAGSPLTAGVQQDLTSMSRTFHTPVTELSSHLFAMGHSRGPSEGSSEEKDVFNNQQQQQ